jgi:hypothetical protein
MFLSKIWFVLVGLLAGAATTAAFVAPRSADRRIVELEGQRLDRAQYAAEQMLKADAHTWIDYAAKLSRDAVLAESLDAVTKGVGEARLLSETVRGRLKTLAPDLPGIGLEGIGAIDARGRVVARIGDRENDGGESVNGIEVLADALRGYLSDDVWGSGGKLQRVAAVPVLSKTRDRIVGAVYVAAETGKRLAEVWKKNLDVDIAILLRGQVATSTVSESFLSDLPRLVAERKGEMAEAKRTRPISLAVGSDRLLAVAAPFVGQAAEQDGLFVLIGKMSPASDPLALLSTTTADDLRWGHFPWLGLGIGLIVILGVGLYLQRLETEKPLAKLRAEVQRMARGEISKLADGDYPGKFGGIARDVNASIERFTLAAPPKSETARKDLDAILGPAPTQPSSVFDLPQSHFGPLGGAGAAPPAPPPSFPLSPPTAPPPRPAASFPLSPPAPAFTSQAPAPPPFPTPSVTPPPMPLSATRPGRAGGTPAPSLTGRTEAALAAMDGEPPTTALPGPSSSLLSSTLSQQPLAHSASAAIDAVDLPDGSPARSEDAGDEAAYDAHVRAVFDEYLATRERCGEPIGSLTLDRFRAKLDANRQQLIVKYNCRSARFAVYVKDGKAAIKATPVR